MIYRLVQIVSVLLASAHVSAQEPVVISVNKPSEVTKAEATENRVLARNAGFFPLGTSANGTVGFLGDIIPTLKSEYDLFSKRDLNFYACGFDIGTEKLMLDMRVKFLQRNGVPTALSDMRLDIGFSSRWHFRKMRLSKFSVLQRKTAFIKYGVSFDHRIGGYGEATDQSTPIEKVQFLNGKFSVNHPISGNLLIGAEVISHFSVRSSQSSYASAGITLSYFISTLD
ncbi:MAG: hypothetical protein AB8B53_03400 [Flavobacteriales bacterium]